MITTKQRAKLRSMANTLKPIVNIGKEELTENILNEIELSLFHHELVKVSCLKSCECSAKSLLVDVCDSLGCEPVCSIGNRFVVYKRSTKDGIEHIELN